jgi:hypothetical protein
VASTVRLSEIILYRTEERGGSCLPVLQLEQKSKLNFLIQRCRRKKLLTTTTKVIIHYLKEDEALIKYFSTFPLDENVWGYMSK